MLVRRLLSDRHGDGEVTVESAGHNGPMGARRTSRGDRAHRPRLAGSEQLRREAASGRRGDRLLLSPTAGSARREPDWADARRVQTPTTRRSRSAARGSDCAAKAKRSTDSDRDLGTRVGSVGSTRRPVAGGWRIRRAPSCSRTRRRGRVRCVSGSAPGAKTRTPRLLRARGARGSRSCGFAACSYLDNTFLGTVNEAFGDARRSAAMTAATRRAGLRALSRSSRWSACGADREDPRRSENVKAARNASRDSTGRGGLLRAPRRSLMSAHNRAGHEVIDGLRARSPRSSNASRRRARRIETASARRYERRAGRSRAAPHYWRARPSASMPAQLGERR